MFVQGSGEGFLAGCKPFDLIDPFVKFVVFLCIILVMDLNNAIFPDLPFSWNSCCCYIVFFQVFTKDVFCFEMKCGHRCPKITAFIAKAR